MRKNPNLIASVEVKYFRSINSQKIKECKPVNIITGSNDIGKSNLLRALNLFFSERNENGREINFREEFSHSRLEAVRKESIKGRQFIQIEVEFNCQDSFQKTLPDRFKVKKTWYRDSKAPLLTHDLEKYIASGALETTTNKAEGSLQRFLNSIIFTYIPAIKDKSIFHTVLSDLQSVLFQQSENNSGDFNTEIERFNAELENQAEELRSAFHTLTGVDARISLPNTYADLFRAFSIKTAGPFDEAVALDNRGDGVRVRFLPAILNYIAERSQKLHVWGIEEPENSMEYRRAFELSETMATTYAKNAQIFITTHSPAFIDLSKSDQSIYMARRESADTVFAHLNSSRKQRVAIDDPYLLIADELGHIRLMNELHDKLQTRLAQAEENEKSLAATLAEVNSLTTPVLLTEGKTDVIILKEAWRRLREGDPPFAIKTCNVLAEDDKNDAAGAGQLGMCLRSIMSDSPQTVVGLFDRDSDGKKAWTLDANFQKFDDLDDVKVSKNGKAFAVLLPIPNIAPELAKSEHHCVELMFPLDAIHTKVDGRGLVLKNIPIETRCGGVVIEKIVGSEIWQLAIQDGKKWFAEKVAPSLTDEKFEAFNQLFETIERILGIDGAKTSKILIEPSLIEPTTPAEPPAYVSEFDVGDRVFHSKFGEGWVRDVDNNKVTIDFDRAGQKRVLDGFIERILNLN